MPAPSTLPLPIRTPSPEEAAVFVDLHHQCDRETDFLLYSGDDRPINAEMMVGVLTRAAEISDPLILCAWDGDTPVAYISGMRGRSPKTCHSIVLGVAVRRDWWGRGLGRDLIQAFETKALTLGIRRIELSVIVENVRAHNLYQTLGYQKEGLRRGSILLADRLVDEVAMVKLLAA